MNDLNRFMDDKGRIKTWASKKEIKAEILSYIASKFENGRFYSEKEVNAVIEEWHTFGDYFLIRRGLIDNWLMSRTKNGARYWKEEKDNCGDIVRMIDENYDAGNIKGIFRFTGGYGSKAYYMMTDKGEFVFKDIEQNHMNHPENEALILEKLKEANIPTAEVVAAKNGDSVFKQDDKVYHLQSYVDGMVLSRNTAPEWLLYESARMLGRIHNALEMLPMLPTGMGQGFFDSMTPDRAKDNYLATLETANEKKDSEIAEAVNDRIRMFTAFEGFHFDLGRMTCKNTHGDYKIQQLIVGKDRINAVIDFTSACVHPVCWEIIRSYCLSDPDCIEGSLNIDHFRRYVASYLEAGSLNTYDLKIMPYVYYYQNLASDYFGQYYRMEEKNKNLLDDAFFSAKLCRWFDRNITSLEDALVSGF